MNMMMRKMKERQLSSKVKETNRRAKSILLQLKMKAEGKEK